MAARAVIEAQNGHKWPYLVLFGGISPEYGHAAHQNVRLDEAVHMEPFSGLYDQNRGHKWP